MFRLELQRLHLGMHQLKHAALLNTWENDPEIRHLVDDRPEGELETMKATEEYLREVLDISPATARLIDYGIYLRESGQLIGWGQIADIDRYHKRCQLGICLCRKRQRGKGLGREALTGIIDYCFDELEMYRIGCHVYAFNIPAVNLVTSLGFVHEGTTRSCILKHDKYEDELSFGLLRAEWQRQTRATSG